MAKYALGPRKRPAHLLGVVLEVMHEGESREVLRRR